MLLSHMKRRANQWWPGWSADLVPLPGAVLISESKSRMYEGLWLREPTQFRFDALPRAKAFLKRFPVPPENDEGSSEVLHLDEKPPYEQLQPTRDDVFIPCHKPESRGA